MTRPLQSVPLLVQEQASRFATTRDDAAATAARIRANGITDALALLRAGLPGSAHAVIMRSFYLQARALGLHLHETDGGETW